MAFGSRRKRGLAVVLGSGLGGAIEGMEIEDRVAFAEIPGLSGSVVPGHPGEVLSLKGGKNLFVLGRKHYYEDGEEETRALFLYLKNKGAGSIVLTSAAGSLSRRLPPGEIVIVEDVVDLQFRKPFASVWGQRGMKSHSCRKVDWERSASMNRSLPERPRFSDSYPFSQNLRELINKSAAASGITLRRGVIAATAGPAYETRAEVEAITFIGADLATMSLAGELGVAKELNLRAAALAIVTNFTTGTSPGKREHEEVVREAGKVAGKLGKLLRQLVA